MNEAKFESKNVVSVRCGGRGADLVGTYVHVKTKAGIWRTVRLAKLLHDYGPGDVATYEVSWK